MRLKNEKMRMTDVANTKKILRIIQSIPCIYQNKSASVALQRIADFVV